jgi:hypothetical protein
MRRSFIIALGTAVALATAAVAVAVIPPVAGVSATTADFAAAKVGDPNTRTCTGADGKAYVITDGRYTGTMTSTSSHPVLTGPLTIHARTTYSTTDTRGYVEGSFRVKDDDSRVNGEFWGTLDGSGNLVGFLEGKSKGNHAVVLGNMSATFAPSTGFTGGKLGAGGSTAVAAVIAGPPCKGPKPAPKPDKPAKLVSVEGVVSALGAGVPPSTITVTSKGPSTATCTRDATSPTTADFPLTTKVEMKCELIGTTWTLRVLKLHK